MFLIADRSGAGMLAQVMSQSAVLLKAVPLVGASLLAKRPAPTPTILTLLKHLLRPLLDLFLSQVFLVRGQEPQVPVGILQGP